MNQEHRQGAAILAASQATEAVAELLRFGTETEGGETLDIVDGDGPVRRLLDAAKMTAEILIAEREQAGEEADDDLNQVVGAIARFNEGWAG